jgi:hypothetical protein
MNRVCVPVRGKKCASIGGTRSHRGYTIGNPFDALVFGYYDRQRLMYVARTRNRFTAASRQRLAEKFGALEIEACPFDNLPQATSGRWGQRVTKERCKCRWLSSVLVGDFDFTEWTADGHLPLCRPARG